MTCPRTGLDARQCPCQGHGDRKAPKRKKPEGDWNGSEDDAVRAYEDRFDELDEGQK